MEEFTLEDWLWFKKKIEVEIDVVSELFTGLILRRVGVSIQAGDIEDTEEVSLKRDGLFFEVVKLKTRLGIVNDIIEADSTFIRT